MTDTLTTEHLKGICNSSFDLVNFAMDLARYYIKTGHEANLKEVLRDVRRNPDPNYVQTLRDIDDEEMKHVVPYER